VVWFLQDHAESAKYLNDIKQGTVKQNPVRNKPPITPPFLSTLDPHLKLLETHATF